jgi:hypothetical protein
MLPTYPSTLSLVLAVAQEDSSLARDFQKHLALLEEQGWVSPWSPEQITAGSNCSEAIQTQCQGADLFLLFISPDFFVSATCQQILLIAQERASSGQAVLIPLLLRSVDLACSPFSRIQLLPHNGCPVEMWSHPDEAWTEITKHLHALMTLLRRPILLAADPSHSELQQQVAHALGVAHVQCWAPFDPSVSLEHMRQVAAVIVLLSTETGYARHLQEVRERAIISQRPLLVLWCDQEEALALRGHQWQSFPYIIWHASSSLHPLLVLLQRRLDIVLYTAPSRLPDPPRNPYKGLRAFEQADAGDFFGRAVLITSLLTMLSNVLSTPGEARLLTVIGPSGSGKSSVVLAGLLPRLQQGALPGSERWVILPRLLPGDDPLGALATTLDTYLPERGLETLYKGLQSGPAQSLDHYARQIVQRQMLCDQRQSPHTSQVVLVLDQGEELFQPAVSMEQRKRFFELLLTAVTVREGPLIVLLTIRADFLDRLMTVPDLYHLVDRQRQSVLPLTISELREAIECPAALPDVQVQMEEHLISDILLALQGQPGTLPLLQFTLDHLFAQREGHLLTRQAYQQMGGVIGALARHAETTYNRLPSDQHRACARSIFLRLVIPGATELEATRRRARQADFPSRPEAQETIDAFVQARLLTATQAEYTSLEVSHEAVLREWPRLVDWIHEQHNDLHFQHLLDNDVDQWEAAQYSKDRLYRGKRLRAAQKWARRSTPSQREQAFLRASTAQQILRGVILFVGVSLLISSMGVVGKLVFLQPSKTLVTTLQDGNDVIGSLRWCITNAPSRSTITFDPSVRGTLELTKGGLEFASGKQLTIEGPGTNQLTITGGDRGTYILVNKGAVVTFSHLSFKNSITSDSYPFLRNYGTLTLSNDVISHNTTKADVTSEGGGIFNAGALTVDHSTISHNASSGRLDAPGGGIFDRGGTLNVQDSTFLNNAASGHEGGGGIYINASGIATITRSTFSGNSASGSGGGAIFITESGIAKITRSTFSDNSASGSGGGINNDATGTLDVQDSHFLKNVGGYGGGIFNFSRAKVTDSTFVDNQASGKPNSQGGGINNAATLTVMNSTFSENKATAINSSGGGIYNYFKGSAVVESSTFSDNTASGQQRGQGGGIDSDGKLIAINSTFVDNSASGDNSSSGGGISFVGFKDSSTLIRFCTIYGNRSSTGGGVWIDPRKSSHQTISGIPADPAESAHLTISESIISANSAHDEQDISAMLLSGGYNLLTNTIGATELNTTTDRQVTVMDLKLDPVLRNNGGPTQTLALLPGSPAIDAVPENACTITFTDVSGHTETITTDQRGFTRFHRPKKSCDIGAI